jgi:hypothetical protein
MTRIVKTVQTRPASIFIELESNMDVEPVKTAIVFELKEFVEVAVRLALLSDIEVTTGVWLGNVPAVATVSVKASADRDAASVDDPDAKVKTECLELWEEILARDLAAISLEATCAEPDTTALTPKLGVDSSWGSEAGVGINTETMFDKELIPVLEPNELIAIELKSEGKEKLEPESGDCLEAGLESEPMKSSLDETPGAGTEVRLAYTGQMVVYVRTSLDWLTILSEAGQFATDEGHAVIFCTNVLYKVSVLYPITSEFVNVASYLTVSIVDTGNSSATVLVIRQVDLSDARQFETDDWQAMMV